MGLVDKLKNAGKALALAGGLGGMAYNSGCTPVAIVGGATIVAKSNRDAAMINAQATRDAAVMQQQAIMQHQRKMTNDDIRIMILERGASRYSVAVAVVSCNYIQNFEGDSCFDYPRDFIGIKKTFKLGERVSPCLAIQGGLFINLEYELRDGNNNLIDEFSINNSSALGEEYIANEKESKFRSALDGKEHIKNLKKGNYRADWYNNKKFIASLNLQITE